MMKRKFFFSFMIIVMMTSAGNSVSQNFIVENDDPFVRGLQRQKTFDGFQKRIGNVTNKNNLKQREENTQRIFDFPNFNQILSFSHYRVDGLLVLEAPQSPVIHLDKSDLKNNNNILFLDPKSRRWIYRPEKDETIKDILDRFRLHSHDLAILNGVSKVEKLLNKDEFFVSPEDNGSLIHEVITGDTLFKLSRIYNISIEELKKENKIASNDWLFKGQNLLIRKNTISEEMKKDLVSVVNFTKKHNSNDGIARKFYVQLFRFKNIIEATSKTNEFYSDYRDFLDTDIILRFENENNNNNNKEEIITLELGPIETLSHAKSYCALFKSFGLECKPIRRMPGNERQKTFNSIASIRFLQNIINQNKVKSKETSLENISTKTFNMYEGQEIGNSGGMVIKITNKEVIAIDFQGQILTLPINSLPMVN